LSLLFEATDRQSTSIDEATYRLFRPVGPKNPGVPSTRLLEPRRHQAPVKKKPSLIRAGQPNLTAGRDVGCHDWVLAALRQPLFPAFHRFHSRLSPPLRWVFSPSCLLHFSFPFVKRTLGFITLPKKNEFVNILLKQKTAIAVITTSLIFIQSFLD
jgi:hypothetical protein